jgi:hypothetical protein
MVVTINVRFTSEYPDYWPQHPLHILTRPLARRIALIAAGPWIYVDRRIKFFVCQQFVQLSDLRLVRPNCCSSCLSISSSNRICCLQRNELIVQSFPIGLLRIDLQCIGFLRTHPQVRPSLRHYREKTVSSDVPVAKSGAIWRSAWMNPMSSIWSASSRTKNCITQLHSAAF